MRAGSVHPRFAAVADTRGVVAMSVLTVGNQTEGRKEVPGER